jgi:predicted DNA-binding transcriptional regulator AlpA
MVRFVFSKGTLPDGTSLFLYSREMTNKTGVSRGWVYFSH